MHWTGSVLISEVHTNPPLPFFFFTTTVLDTHCGYKTSQTALAFKSRSTSSHTTFACWGAVLLAFWTTCLYLGDTFSSWQAKLGSMPGASYGVHAKMSWYSFSRTSNWDLCSAEKGSPIRKCLWFSPSTTGTGTSSSAHFSWGRRFSRSSQFGNCYLSLAVPSLWSGISGAFCLTVATRHCFVANWSPTIFMMPCGVGNLSH